MSEWISVKDRLPDEETEVVVVKELWNGERKIDLAHFFPDFEYNDPETRRTRHGPYWVCGAKKVVYWMALPELPAEESR